MFEESKSFHEQTFQFVRAGENFSLIKFEFIVEKFSFSRRFMTSLRDKLVESLLEKHFPDIATWEKFSLADDVKASERFLTSTMYLYFFVW